MSVVFCRGFMSNDGDHTNDNYRVTALVLGLIGVSFGAFWGHTVIQEACSFDCWFWWLIYFAMSIGILLLCELSIQRQKATGEWYQDAPKNKPSTKRQYGWGAASLRRVLSAALLAMPLIFRVTLGLFMGSLFLGAGSYVFYMGITNQMPESKDEESGV